MLIGLDCAEPSLVLERWRDQLPTFSGLMQRGTYGRLTSVIPPITVPAWSCMMSSKTPGDLGVYGFRNRSDHSYDSGFIAMSRDGPDASTRGSLTERRAVRRRTRGRRRAPRTRVGRGRHEERRVWILVVPHEAPELLLER
jgi:hypothetical protein